MKSVISTRGGANLRFLRKQRSMSAEDLSAAMMDRFGEDISPSAILKYESGERPITQEHIVQFASCLNCSIAALMDGLDLNQEPQEESQELRQLSHDSHNTFHWVATKWHGDIDALITAFGLYAATPGAYRRYAMMELIVQRDRAIREGAMTVSDIPESVIRGLPHVEDLLGGLYEE